MKKQILLVTILVTVAVLGAFVMVENPFKDISQQDKFSDISINPKENMTIEAIENDGV